MNAAGQLRTDRASFLAACKALLPPETHRNLTRHLDALLELAQRVGVLSERRRLRDAVVGAINETGDEM